MRNDINLIPKINGFVSTKTMIIVILASMCSFLMMGFCGVFLPLWEKNELNNKIMQKQEKLLLYSNVEVTYITLLDKINKLNNLNTVFESLKSNQNKMTEIFKDFQENIPDNITIHNISYSNEVLLMDGVSPSYKEIASYIVNLRKLEYVKNVGFTSAEYKMPVNTDTGNGDEDSMYQFNISVSLKTNNPPTPEQTLQQGEITDENGGN